MNDPFTKLDDIGIMFQEQEHVVSEIIDIGKDQVLAAMRLLIAHGVDVDEIREHVLEPFEPRFDALTKRLDASVKMFATKSEEE